MALGTPLSRSSELGVFCVESWSGDLRNKTTVRPLLDVLSERSGLRFIHRTVDSGTQLVDYLKRWSNYAGYRVGYIACHGSAGEIYIGPDTLSITELADQLERSKVDLSGRTLYLGSCAGMKTTRAALRDLRERTGLACVCGFKGEDGVNWLESAAFELLLFQALALTPYAQHRYALRDLVADHQQLARRLEFRFDPAIPKARHRA